MDPSLPRRARTARDLLWAAGAIGVAISGLMLGMDSLNHSRLLPGHVALLGASILVSALAAVLARRLSPLVGAITYGAMMASAVFVFGLGIAVLKTRSLPVDAEFNRVLLVSLVVLAVSLPMVLAIRRRERIRRSVN